MLLSCAIIEKLLLAIYEVVYMMIDMNKPVANDELVKQIEIMKTENTQESKNLFVSNMLAARFLVPVIVNFAPHSGNISKNKDGAFPIPQGTKISFHSFKSTDGEVFHMAFTDKKELMKWSGYKSGMQLALLTFWDFGNMVKNPDTSFGGFVINPFSHNMLVRRGMIQSIKFQLEKQKKASAVHKKQSNATQERIYIGEPETDTALLIAALTNYFRSRKDVSRAYILQMIRAEKKSVLIVVDFDGDKDSLFTAITRLASSLPHDGDAISLVPAGDPFGIKVTQDKTPFYVR